MSKLIIFLLLAGLGIISCNAYHIAPLNKEDASETLIDISGLGEAYEFMESDELEIQVLSTTPTWTIKNFRMSTKLFIGTTDDETIRCSIYRHISEGEDGSSNFVVGTVHDTTTGMVYEMTRNAKGEQIVIEKLESDYPKQGDTLGVAPDDSNNSDEAFPDDDPGATTSSDEESETVTPKSASIVAFLVWTENAECFQSGQSSGCTVSSTTYSTMQAAIDAAMTETNTVHSNSRTGVTFTWTSDRDTSGYSETGILLNALDRLQATSDGFLDNIHTLRAQRGADLVTVVTADADYCGWATLFGSPPNDQFSVISRSCLSVGRSYTTVHEYGHNMGCLHGRGDYTNRCSSSTRSFGWKTSSWRTVMAYQCTTTDPCFGNLGTDCATIPYFSNTVFTWGGASMGGSFNNCRAQVISAAPRIAAYYSPNTPTSPTAPSAPTTPGNAPTQAPDCGTPCPTVSTNIFIGSSLSVMKSFFGWFVR